ncbi:MAG: DUF5011 domain-containing protein, partial [Verrucomicrobia bacterium]|nr:DUF5011 domain-containing protein [Verrucomicrobiota bacterium]
MVVSNPDTDGDGVTDVMELADGTNPNDANSFNSLSKGLVAYYPFNGNANDALGGKPALSLFGSSSFLTNGLSGGALRTDGDRSLYYNGGGYFSPAYLENSILNAASFVFWTRNDLTGGAYSPSHTEEAWLEVGYGDTGAVAQIYGRALGTSGTFGTVTVNWADWKMFTMTISNNLTGSDWIQYLNGTEIARGSTSQKLLPTANIKFGKHTWNGGAAQSARMTVEWDNLRLYDRTLSPLEVGQLYQQDAGSLDSDGDGLSDAWERGYGRYQIISGNFTWDQAKADAEARGGHLATITSQAEHDTIAGSLGLSKMAEIMLGGFQPAGSLEPAGGWAWVTGEPWSYTRWDTASNQPDNYGGAQNILRLWPAGMWDDIQFNSADNKGYLLELGYPTDPTKADTDGDGFDDSIESHYASDPNDPAVTPNTIRAPGYLVTWGSEQYGKALVPPEFRPHPSFAPVVIEASAGWSHTAALRQNGTVAVWGHDLNGRTQVPAGISRAVSVVAGGDHTLVLQGDGTVVAWGDNQNGQSVVPSGLRNVVQLAAGFRHSLALRSDGTVVGWGYNGDGAVTIPTNLGKVKNIAAGLYHSMAILEDGTIAVWGSNEYGKATPPAGLTQIVELSAGWSHSIARDAAGNLTAWGANPDGRTTIPAGLGPVRAVSAGGDHNLALRPNGTVAAWGRNSDGQINVPANLVGVIRIASGYWHSIALTTDSTNREIPLITLIGANPLEIYKGSTFIDPGAMVTDNVDATRSITGSGAVDTSTVGIYTVTYTATDVTGNLALPVTRTVNVVLDPAADEDGDGLTNGT